jgi:hypothetical protein
MGSPGAYRNGTEKADHVTARIIRMSLPTVSLVSPRQL